MAHAKDLWAAVWDAVEQGELDALDGLFAEDARFGTSSAEGSGREYVKGVLGRHLESYPDLRREIVDVVESADGSVVCVEVFFTGTHKGALVHPNGGRIEPTGRTLRWRAVDKVTTDGELITSWTAIFDRLSLLQQVT